MTSKQLSVVILRVLNIAVQAVMVPTSIKIALSYLSESNTLTVLRAPQHLIDAADLDGDFD
ncbi:hypothetical protein BOO91_10600 [Vibrio navarrensis]|nr:hypothetical protein [Vibrio navarrensis]MBE4612273.1 hypothetical protein [Vibrio navarrensis]